jgi:hypothetical protein
VEPTSKEVPIKKENWISKSLKKITKKCEDDDKIFSLKDLEKEDLGKKLNIDFYIEKRVMNKIEFFRCLMHRDKKKYEHYQIVIIIIAGLISIVSSIFSWNHDLNQNLLPPFTAISGALVIAITSIVSFYKYQDRMINFKIALRSLERELCLFINRAGEYSDEQKGKDVEKIFVSRIEEILQKEALGYIAIINQNKKDNDTNQNITNSGHTNTNKDNEINNSNTLN